MDGPTLLYHLHVKHCHRPGDTEHQVEGLASAIKQGITGDKNSIRQLIITSESKKGCKDQESIQSSTTPYPGYQSRKD